MALARFEHRLQRANRRRAKAVARYEQALIRAQAKVAAKT